MRCWLLWSTCCVAQELVKSGRCCLFECWNTTEALPPEARPFIPVSWAPLSFFHFRQPLTGFPCSLTGPLGPLILFCAYLYCCLLSLVTLCSRGTPLDSSRTPVLSILVVFLPFRSVSIRWVCCSLCLLASSVALSFMFHRLGLFSGFRCVYRLFWYHFSVSCNDLPFVGVYFAYHCTPCLGIFVFFPYFSCIFLALCQSSQASLS